MTPPLYDRGGELCHINNYDGNIAINSLKGMYRSESELLALLNFLNTLEKIGLLQ